MTLSDSLTTKINELATAIHNKITNVRTALTTHENITSSSLQKGHSQAGGAPQTIGQSLSAGTDNGYYARADHIHTVDYTNILNKPTTFNPSIHDHNDSYYTKGEINQLLNDVVIDRIFIDENGNITIGTNVSGMLLSANKNIVQSYETTTLTTTAYDLYSDTVENQPIQLYKDDVLLGIYNTDSNGQITYTYTGNGSGKHIFVARHGRFQSELYTLWDTLFYDSGLEGSKNTNWTASGVTPQPTSDGTLLEASSSFLYTSNQTLTGDFEAKVHISSSVNGVRVGVKESSNYTRARIYTTGYVKIRRVNGVVTISISSDDTTYTEVTYDGNTLTTEDCNFYFYSYTTGATCSIKYDDLKIYSI